MQGVVFLGNRQLELREFPDPTPGPDEVIIEIKASGMCGSDLKMYRAPGGAASFGYDIGDEPIIGGHEPCGIVVEVGSSVSPAEARVGQRVMDHHYCGCGVCGECRTGWSQLCHEGFVVYGVTTHGAHARYMKVPARTLVPLPDALSFEAGAAIACGTGTAYNALCRMNLTGRDTIAIFGQGPVGLSATQLASAMGARVIALDISRSRRESASTFGAAAALDPAADDVLDELHSLTAGRGVDMALDCSGAPAARLQAIQSTRTWGSVCFVGEGNDLTVDVSKDIIRKQLTLLGSWTFSAVGQAECARFIVERDIDVDRLFTDRYYALEDAPDAYAAFDRQAGGKGVFLL